MLIYERSETSRHQSLTEFGAQFQIPKIQDIVPHGEGTMNETFLVQTSGPPFILQKLRPAYTYGSLEDYEAISQGVERAGILTPRIVSTQNGFLGTRRDNRLWRMTTFVPGVTLEEAPTPSQAKSAGALLGRWHDGLSTFDYNFRFKLPDFHNTPKKMIDLQEALQRYRHTHKYKQLLPLAENVLTAYLPLGDTTANLPRRIIHGDPHFPNFRFTPDGSEAISLLDLDTLGHDSVVIDIADAVRSFTQEQDTHAPYRAFFNCDIFQRMLYGYRETAHFLTSEELYTIPDGIEQITLELTARFIIDAFEETYFRHDPKLYSNLFEQNMVNALAQFNFYRSFVAQRASVEDMIMQT